MASGKKQCRVFNLISWQQGIVWRISHRVMHVFFREYTHKYMENTVDFDVLGVHKNKNKKTLFRVGTYKNKTILAPKWSLVSDIK